MKKFLGQPIIKRVIKILKKTNMFNDIYISTDSLKIGNYVKKLGVKFTFLRPKHLANDFSDTIDVMQHASIYLKKIKKNYNFDVCCIYPTAVFTKMNDLKNLIKCLPKINLNTFSALPFEYPFQRSFYLKKNKINMLDSRFYKTRSQDLKVLYHDLGQFYWAKNSTWLKKKKIFGKNSGVYLMRDDVVDIDDLSDWKKAEKIYKIRNKI